MPFHRHPHRHQRENSDHQQARERALLVTAEIMLTTDDLSKGALLDTAEIMLTTGKLSKGAFLVTA